MDGTWTAQTGRAALGLLGAQGAWRLAGEDGWLVLLALVDDDEPERAERHLRRIAKRAPKGERLSVLPSSLFPELNPGFLVVMPDPYPDEASARAALQSWPGRTARSYVKRGWKVVDPCG